MRGGSIVHEERIEYVPSSLAYISAATHLAVAYNCIFSLVLMRGGSIVHEERIEYVPSSLASYSSAATHLAVAYTCIFRAWCWCVVGVLCMRSG